MAADEQEQEEVSLVDRMAQRVRRYMEATGTELEAALGVLFHPLNFGGTESERDAALEAVAQQLRAEHAPAPEPEA